MPGSLCVDAGKALRGARGRALPSGGAAALPPERFGYFQYQAALFVVDGEIQIALPGTDALAESPEPHRLAHRKIRRQGHFHRMQFVGKAAPYLEADASAGRQVGGGQAQALFLIDLAPEPVLDDALDALAQVEVPVGRAPGDVALVESGVLPGGGRFLARRRLLAGPWPGGAGAFLLRRRARAGLLAVEFAVNVLKNAAREGVIEQVAQDVLLGIGFLRPFLFTGGLAALRLLRAGCRAVRPPGLSGVSRLSAVSVACAPDAAPASAVSAVVVFSASAAAARFASSAGLSRAVSAT